MIKHKITEESVQLRDTLLTFQVGKLAPYATSAVFARLGETSVLVTVTVGEKRDDLDYFPLSVSYVEKLYAGGKIKGSRWVKREGKPSDDAILRARLIDRSIRPLFPKSYKRDVQIVITLLSFDGVNSPEILAGIATSAALHISPIPWDGPISMMRIGYVKSNGEGNYIVSPTEDEQRFSSLDLVVSSTKDKVVMIETGAEEISKDIIYEGILLAKSENKKVIEAIENLREKVGAPKEKVVEEEADAKVMNLIKKHCLTDAKSLLFDNLSKEEKRNVRKKIIDLVADADNSLDQKVIDKNLEYVLKEMLRKYVLDNKKRVDGRKIDEIRELYAEVSVLSRTHGSAIFQRGNTQVLSIATLGSPDLEQLIESPEGEEVKRYIHHYYMPPYSVGETGRIGYPSRREIGHGALAEKALIPVLPSSEEFPYTIRVVSEVLASNGSTSMASTCGSTLSLMDAGVPIKDIVAGISVGMISRKDEYVLLTDIMGVEDFYGDMDFKVAGTKSGITAIQLDVKVHGLTDQMIKDTLNRAREARLKILDLMSSVINKPRFEVSKFAPKVVVFKPPQDKIGEIIGPGGKNIRNLIAITGTDISVSDDGKVSITGNDKSKVDKAVELIKGMIKNVEVGEIFDGKVTKVLPFGIVVEIAPGKDGLVHVSKMGKGFIKDVEKLFKIGDDVKVKVIQVDPQGRTSLQLLSEIKRA